MLFQALNQANVAEVTGLFLLRQGGNSTNMEFHIIQKVDTSSTKVDTFSRKVDSSQAKVDTYEQSAKQLSKSVDYFKNKVFPELMRTGKLEKRFSFTHNHPEQGYKSVSEHG